MSQGEAPATTRSADLMIENSSDRKALLSFMHKTYQELCPSADRLHLKETVHQLWSEHTWFWVVSVPAESEPIGCLWLGSATDPLTGDGYPHIFLLYVDPSYRYQGVGSALMEHAEQWSRSKGYRRVGIQVFAENVSALSLYKKLGYCTESIVLQKALTSAR